MSGAWPALVAILLLPVWAGFPEAARRARPAAAAGHASLSQPPAPIAGTRVDASRLIADVKALSAPELEGRLPGTRGSRRAQTFIIERFKSLELQPVNGSYLRTFPLRGSSGGAPASPEGTNLLAMIPGSGARDRYVLVSAHYDHLGVRHGQTYHGADDNASGVAAMLAIAAWFAANPPRSSLLFVAFDAEEDGLQGSRHFVSAPPIDLKRVQAVVNLDMIGRGDNGILYAAGAYHYPALKTAVDERVAGRAVKVVYGHDRPDARGMADWTLLSDHGSFHAAGIPFLYLGVDDHADYHKPTDTADKIPVAFFRGAAEVALETVRRLSDAGLRSGAPR